MTYVRFITDHGPTGDYRLRFNIHPSKGVCFCNPPFVHKHFRLHVLLKCAIFSRTEPYAWKTDGDFLADLDPFPKIREFLEENPSAYSFNGGGVFDPPFNVEYTQREDPTLLRTFYRTFRGRPR